MRVAHRPGTSQLAALREKIAEFEGKSPPSMGRVVSTGCAVLDQLLPMGGWRLGGVVEWLVNPEGWGETLACWGAAQVARQTVSQASWVVISDPALHWYPLAASGVGLDLERTLIVHPENRSDALWALDQALRSPGVSAVWGPLERLTTREARRLQLAAETGGTCGFLVRPARARGEPSWSDCQLLVAAEPRSAVGGSFPRVRVELLRSRWGPAGGALHLELDPAGRTFRSACSSSLDRCSVLGHHASLSLPASAPLAPATAARRQA